VVDPIERDHWQNEVKANDLYFDWYFDLYWVFDVG
jgi:hypothetical protein